jgi:hypothetical protein
MRVRPAADSRADMVKRWTIVASIVGVARADEVIE